MDKLPLLCRRNGQFRESIRSAVGHFRSGEDHSGLDDFLTGMDDMESTVDICQCLGGNGADIAKMLPAFQKLLECIKNCDVVGLTDILEFYIYPLSGEWLKGCEKV